MLLNILFGNDLPALNGTPPLLVADPPLIFRVTFGLYLFIAEVSPVKDMYIESHFTIAPALIWICLLISSAYSCDVCIGNALATLAPLTIISPSCFDIKYASESAPPVVGNASVVYMLYSFCETYLMPPVTYGWSYPNPSKRITVLLGTDSTFHAQL